ncbi:MAG: peptidoglycan-binding protein, partial [Sulfuricurvum sp.]|nr:peptidoglycan-binding protein [Sulfuricurvum sp.]
MKFLIKKGEIVKVLAFFLIFLSHPYLWADLADTSILKPISSFSASSHGYQKLREILIKYLKIEEAGGWKQSVSSYPNTHETEPYFADELKERLRVEGDLSADDNSSEGYEKAIKHFQRRHGIKPDGRVGEETLSKLNISVQEKITAIRLNMERWKVMPEEMENPYISVNIPDFSLSVIEDNKTVLSMKAIVGREGRETPIFNAKM